MSSAQFAIGAAAALLLILLFGAGVGARLARERSRRSAATATSGGFATVARIDPGQAAGEIINTMADGLIVFDLSGHILLANHAVERILGYPPSELVGRSVDLLVTDFDATIRHSDRLQRVLEGGTARDQERRFLKRDGSVVDVSISASSLVRHGQHTGVVLAIRDISERRLAEEEVRRTASILSSTLESTADGILVTDRFGNAVVFNRQLASLMRADEALWRGSAAGTARLIDDVLGRLADSERFWTTLRQLLERPRAESFDVLELKDGRTLEVRSFPQKSGDETIGRVWSFREVTQRRRSEAALRASEKRYRQLFERNLAGVYRTSPDGTILDCNEAFARMFGWSSQREIVGHNAVELFFDPRERAEIIQMLSGVRNISGLELCLRKKDGSRVWVLENMSLIEEEGEVPAIEGTLVDISGLKIAEEQMEFQAYHDVLTTLPNRKLFTDRLTLALAQARRSGAMLAVMFLDLDHFKTVNDTMGHTAGDELLLSVAERLIGSVREGDTVARIGGDEFTILCTDLKEPEDAVGVAEQLLAAIEAPLAIGDHQLFVTASIGVALYPGDGTDAETLLKNADSALYRAKDSGRNNFQLCTDELKTRAQERLALENSIRMALENDEFELYYQPVVDVETGRISAVEALLRWNHPDLGFMSPDRFVPLLENSRLVFPVGEWVIRTACRQGKKWMDEGIVDFCVSVNLSPRQFQQRDLEKMIRGVLAETGLPSDHLQVEITENTAMDNIERTAGTLRALRDTGVSISIDDFGVGYSSLSYLKRLPIDAVKIDRSFVRDLDTDASDVAIIHAVLGIGKILNFRVIAEGVETERQFTLLRDHGCREMQGFLFSRPVPPDELTGALLGGVHPVYIPQVS